KYGFMEIPNAPEALGLVRTFENGFKPEQTTYYLGRQTLIPTARAGMPMWRKKIFRIMQRNARPATAFFGVPPGRVVELGAQVQF
nr:potassium transporter Kup [Gemmatimonadales bacterium]